MFQFSRIYPRDGIIAKKGCTDCVNIEKLPSLLGSITKKTKLQVGQRRVHRHVHLQSDSSLRYNKYMSFSVNFIFAKCNSKAHFYCRLNTFGLDHWHSPFQQQAIVMIHDSYYVLVCVMELLSVPDDRKKPKTLLAALVKHPRTHTHSENKPHKATQRCFNDVYCIILRKRCVIFMFLDKLGNWGKVRCSKGVKKPDS